MNNRGYKYEGEMNVSVLNEEFTTDARQQIFEQLVGEENISFLSDDAKK